jgi:hypothetical protein
VNARDIARDLVVLKVLADRVKQATAQRKADAMDAMDVEDRKGAVLPDGQKVGTVSVARGRESWTADPTDPDLLAWVQEHHPSEIQTVTTTSVRPAFLRALTERAKADGAAVDHDTGEAIPGIRCTTGEPYVMVRVSGVQSDLIAAALADGAIALPDFTGPPELDAIEDAS